MSIPVPPNPGDNPNNYQGKTNVELAQDFLDHVASDKSQQKTQKHWRALMEKFKCWHLDGMADVVNLAVERVFKHILVAGFTDRYFQTYLEMAMRNNVLQQLKANKKTTSWDAQPQWLEWSNEGYEEEVAERLAAEREEEALLARFQFALAQLAEPGREALNVARLDELEFKAVQRALGLTSGQVKMRVRKATREVQEYAARYPCLTWAVVVGTGHSVSLAGRVRDDATGRLLNPRGKSGEHQYVLLPCAATQQLKQHLIHELTYYAHGDTHELPGRVVHVDADVTNNHVDNLYFEADLPDAIQR